VLLLPRSTVSRALLAVAARVPSAPSSMATSAQSVPAKDAGDAGAVSSTESSGWTLPFFVRVILLGSEGQGVLMERLADSWDLPFFVYPARFDVEKVCNDVRAAVARDSNVAYFSVNGDLFGAYAEIGPPPKRDAGVASLLLMECHGDQLRPSDKYSWKDAAGVAELLAGVKDRTVRQALEIVSTLLSGDSACVAALLVDPRFRLGWFDRATVWLTSLVTAMGATICGRVVQTDVSVSSTILKIDSTAGVLYLKAAALGSREVELTQTVASLFPDDTLQVVGSSRDLKCFASRAFSPLPDKKDLATIALLLGRLQLGSLCRLDDLRAGGFLERGPMALAAEMRRWVNDDLLRRWFGHPDRYARLDKYVPHLVNICGLLANSNIPLMLVHGDVSPRNVGLAAGDRPGQPILFDWEFACIGHPFCDWHELHGKVSKEDRQAYLQLFANYGEAHGLETLYDAGRTLGWCMKMWSVLEQARQCDMEVFSSHADAFLLFWERALESLMDVSPPGVPKDVGPKWRFL